MIPTSDLTPRYIMQTFRRRFWYIILPFFVVSLTATLYCIKAPKAYRATTLILVEPQKVPSEYVRTTVTTDLQSRLKTISQQIKSRTRLEKTIRNFDLFSSIIATGTMTEAVEAMRRKIEIEVRSSRRGGSYFEISFQGDDPMKVRDVTNTIARLFIEDNLKLRKSQASSTTTFLNRELVRMENLLRKKEEQVVKFKEKYIGMLPEQTETNHRMLNHYQQKLDSINTIIQQIEDRKIILQTKLNDLQNSTTDIYGDGLSAVDNRKAQGSSFKDLRRELRNLELRYTDRHPDILRLKKTIARLEREKMQKDRVLSEPGPKDSDSPTDTIGLIHTQEINYLTDMKSLKEEIRRLQERKMKVEKQIDIYRKRIDQAHSVEAIYVDIKRDYEQANANYQTLVNKKFQAEMAENLEKSQQGEQFKILDPAKLPDKPYKPEPKKILFLSYSFALASGFGLALLREHFDKTFWSRREVERVLKLPVLVSIPIINAQEEFRRTILKKAGGLFILLLMTSFLLCSLFVLGKNNPSFF